MVEVKEIAWGSEAYGVLLALRQAELRTPLGLVYSEADIEGERDDVCLGVYREGGGTKTLVGGVLLRPGRGEDGGWLQIRQMAVASTCQGLGLGRILMDAAEAHGRYVLGYTRIFLNAREYVTGFYGACGYTAVGELFEVVGIPHVRMEKIVGDDLRR